MTNTNPYCAALGIPVPRVETACSSPDANYYGLLLVALLERGAPLTLEEAAARFEAAPERSVDDQRRVSRMQPHRLDFGLDLGRLLLQQLGVRPQFFPTQAICCGARCVEELEALPTVSHLSPRRYDLFEQLRELSALFQRLMQERAAVFQQALPFFLSQPTGENQPADHARERAGCLLVARPF